MYDEMMTALLCIVLCPEVVAQDPIKAGLWEWVTHPQESRPTGDAVCWKNLLKWRAFTRKNREKILAEYAAVSVTA